MTLHVPDPDGSRAVLVGVPEVVEGRFERLDYVARNLEDLRAALSHPRRGILPRKAITVLTSPDSNTWLTALHRAGQETTDLLFFYFAGHGYRDPFDNRLYLMTPEANLDVNLEGTAVEWTRVLRTLEGMTFRRAVLILDCCNSGLAAVSGGHVGSSEHYILSSALPTRTQPSDSVESGRSRFTHEVITAMESVGPGSPHLTMQHLYDHLRAVTGQWPVGFGDGWGPKGGSSGDGPGIVIAIDAVRTPAGRELPGWEPAGPGPGPKPPPRPPRPPVGGDGRGDSDGTGDGDSAGDGDGTGHGGPVTPWQWAADRWKTLLAAGLALILAIGFGVYAIGHGRGNPAAFCPPPLELRLMSGTETRAAAQRAVTAYAKDPANRERLGEDDRAPTGCRRANFTVFDAGAGETVEAFGATDAWAGRAGAEGGPSPLISSSADRAAGPCPRESAATGAPPAGELCVDPLQHVGPQPDLLLSGSAAELGRIQGQMERSPGPAELRALGRIGYSPLVLAVPASLEKKLHAEGVGRTGSTWEELLDALDRADPGLPVLRPDPDTSGTGLLQTIGLYEAYDGQLTGGTGQDADGVETRLRAHRGDTLPAPDADSLLCALDDDGPGKKRRLGSAAALVSEKSVADFNLGRRPGSACDNSRPVDARSRLLAYYPKGVPALDMTLSEVRWGGARDRSRRTAAIEHFHDWLMGEEGRGTFLDGLVRGAREDGTPLPPHGQAWDDTAGSGVLRDVPVGTASVGGSTADDVVAQYTRTRTPGQVLFLVDVSGSMAEDGKRALAAAALSESIRRLGPQDTYGVRSYPKSAGHPDRARTVVEPGTPGNVRAKALAWADALTEKPMSSSGAAVYEVLERSLRDTHGEDRPLIVLITDGDNRPEGDDGTAAQAAMRDEQAREGSAKVLVLYVGPDGCTTDVSQFRNPPRAGCFSGRPDRAAEDLAEQVANEVRGGTRDEAP
ncbi:hypothetical protein [Streptomyces sp. NPDC051776]|uniref:hypothetical protein n=1 Tax=Streptomyces sp. NPDC051776 TaxID=3155414 RepID=UPI00343A93B6